MDTLSHTLWGYGLFGYERYAALAMLFGAMPDLISFGAYMLIQIVQGTWHPGPPPVASLPQWLFTSYAFGHSFIISLSFVSVVALLRRPIAFAMLAWPFHIMLDFPFHSFKYFPTPIFWPLSDFKLDGIPWTHWYIWLPNVAGLILLFYYRRRRKLN
jgi:hypothetical protein